MGFALVALSRLDRITLVDLALLIAHQRCVVLALQAIHHLTEAFAQLPVIKSRSSGHDGTSHANLPGRCGRVSMILIRLWFWLGAAGRPSNAGARAVMRMGWLRSVCAIFAAVDNKRLIVLHFVTLARRRSH